MDVNRNLKQDNWGIGNLVVLSNPNSKYAMDRYIQRDSTSKNAKEKGITDDYKNKEIRISRSHSEE